MFCLRERILWIGAECHSILFSFFSVMRLPKRILWIEAPND